MITYNQIIELLSNISDAHRVISSFNSGNVWEIETELEANRNFVKLWAAPVSSTVRGNTIINRFNLLAFDLVEKGGANQNDVLSDTQQCLYDVIKVLRNNAGEQYDVTGNPQLLPFKEQFGDWVSGWRTEIDIITVYNENGCDTPIDDFLIPQGGDGTGPVYTWLRCDTLAACETFLELESRVDNLEVFAGVPTSRTITINGTTYDLTTDRSWTVGDLRSDQTYADPTWLTSLAFSKITGMPNYQPLDADLTAIAALTGTSGFLKTNGAGTWTVDTNTYLTSSALTSYVPYTGATGDVDLGTYSLNAGSVKVNGTNGGGHIHFKHQASDAPSQASSTTLFADSNGNFKYKNDGGSYVTLVTNAITGDRAYTYQDASGTLAFLSDLSGYQPLDGDLTAIAALSTTGFAKRTGANTWTAGAIVYSDLGSGYTSGTKYLQYDGVSLTWATVAGGTGDHTALTNLGWTASGHTGTANRIAGFDGSGATSFYVIGTDIQAYDGDLAAIAALAGTSGFAKKTGANTWTLDTNTYLTSYTETDPIYVASSWYTTTNNASNWDTAYTNRITSLTTTGSSGAATLITNTLNIPNYTLAGLGGQPLNTNLTSLGGLSYVSASFVKMTAAGTFALDTNTYLTGNQSITLSGDVSGTGTTAITTTIGALKVTNGMLAGSIEASKLIGTDIATVGTITTGTWNGTKIAEAYGGTNQSTYATGDILYASGVNTLSKLAAGTNGYVLTLAGGVPTWAASASGFSDPMTTRGDIIYRNSSNTTARLALGTSGQVLTSNGTDLVWSTPSSGSATVPGDKFILNEDFNKMSLPDEWQQFNSGTGSGASYLHDSTYPGQYYPGPGTSSGASSGYAYITPMSMQTSGYGVANGDIRFKVIVKTASITFNGTEDFEYIFGLNASNFGYSNYGVRILARNGVNSGYWYFQYYTTSAQVTITASTAGALTADTWYVLEFTVTGANHDCEFFVNGTSEGTGTPGTKITAGQESGGPWIGIRKHASAGAHPRPKIDYVYWEQDLARV